MVLRCSTGARHLLASGGIGDAVAARSDDNRLAWSGSAWWPVGVLFKVGAVPFHSWVPDVYQGAPTPVTRVHGRGHQDRGVRRDAAHLLRRGPRTAGRLATDDVVIAVATMVVGTITRGHAEPTSSGCWRIRLWRMPVSS